MTPDERWLAAVWPFVRAGLPSPPAAVLEIGCGRLGGFVPALLRDGYDAVGVDPEAPEGPGYHRIEFEAYQSPRPVDGVVACTSLHHVADLGEVLDRVGRVRPALGWVLPGVGDTGGAALRRGNRARAGRAVRPPAVWGRAVLLRRPCRHHRGGRAGRDRRWAGPGERHLVHRPATLSPRLLVSGRRGVVEMEQAQA